MRKVLLVAGLGAAMAPLQAQQAQVVRVAGDSVRVYFAQRANVADVRALRTQLDSLLARVKRVETQHEDAKSAFLSDQQSNAARERLVRAGEALAQAYEAVYPTQSELTLVCAALRARAPRAREGYLGFNLDVGVEATTMPRGGFVVMQRSANRVGHVEPGSPAARAGVRVGEEWIALNGLRVEDLSDRQLDELLKPGANVVLRLRTDDREREVNVMVGRAPAFPSKECEPAGGFALLAPLFDGSRAFAGSANGAEVRGRIRTAPRMQMEAILPQIFASDGQVMMYGATFSWLSPDKREVVKVNDDGVIVVGVSRGTPAFTAGLKDFDVVTRVNGQPVSSPMDVRRLFAGEQTLVLTVVRGGESRTVTLTSGR